jgi:hypothetical protein
MAEAPGVHYIHEPFNVSDPPPGVSTIRFRHWFTYVCAENQAPYVDALGKTMRLEYDLRSVVHTLPARWRHIPTIAEEYWRLRRQRLARARPLIKDPLALFSAPWLADRFDMDVVVLIRHPAAFASSLLRLGWSHPFAHFLAQPLLLRDVISPFEDEIRAFASHPPPILDQAILLWRIIYHTVRQYQATHREWTFVRHEDLSRDPVQGFHDLFRRVDLPFSAHAEAQVLEYSAAPVPAESVAEPTSRPYALHRNSRQNLDVWRMSLTTAAVRRIRERTADIACHFYEDGEW